MAALTTKYQLMLLIVWVLTIFYRTQFADVSLIDDCGALNGFLTQEHFTLKEFFFPRTDNGAYYRPLIGISYWIDKELWFLGAKNLHLESILGHLLNCILLFFSARVASQLCLKTCTNYLPLFVALLFSVHPIVTESVNWISGRTDIMMSSFLLISLLCILQYKLNRSRYCLFIGLLSAAVAMLAKESALGYIIGLPLLFCWHTHTNDLQGTVKTFERSFKLILFLCVYVLSVMVALYTSIYWLELVFGAAYLFVLLYHERYDRCSIYSSVAVLRLSFLLPTFFGAVIFFVGIRKAVFTSNIGKIGQTVTLILSDINYTISVFLGALGFYIKKFFLPLPLNFFIHEIDPLYDLLGIAAFLGILYLLTVKDMSAVFALIGFLLLAPALPFAFGTIAWSGYAERYIYLSTALWVLAVSLALYGVLDHYHYLLRPVRYVAVLLCIVAGSITFIRNGVWQSNVSLMKDTVSQNPGMRMLHDVYIKSLLNAGMTAEAEREYKHALKVAPATVYNDTSDLAMGGVLASEGRYEDALELYQIALNRTEFASEGLLTAAIELLRTMQLEKKIDRNRKLWLQALECEYVDRLLKITKNPRLMLKKGQRALAVGSYSEAHDWFVKALNNTSIRDSKLRSSLEILKHESEQ